MSDEDISLFDLAIKSGVELRTLRSWIHQGLVSGPDSRGRNARYAASALTRARAVRAMRDIYGMSIPAIRQELLVASNERLLNYAAIADGQSSSSIQQPMEPPAGSTAADYLKALRATGIYGAVSDKSDTNPLQPRTVQIPPLSIEPIAGSLPLNVPAITRLQSVIELLRRAGAQRAASRQIQGEVRIHLSVTPDIELTIRGELPPEEIAQFQEIADLLRDMLTGARKI